MKYIKSFKESLISEGKDKRNDINRLNQEFPCAVYNSDVPELVGIFFSRELASKYIFGSHTTKKITGVIKRKSIIRADRNILGFNIAIRTANPAQREMLGYEKYIIMKDYPKPNYGLGSTTFPAPVNIGLDPDGRKEKHYQNLRDNKKDRELIDEMNPIKTRDVK